MTQRTAKCGCGEVTVEARGEPGAVVMCHCTDCQRRTGSAYGLGAYFAPEQIVVRGETRSFSRPTDSGETFISNFCPKCGTSMTWRLEPDDGRVGVAVGAFADPQFAPPVRSVWEQSKHAWVSVEKIPQRFQKGRQP